MRILHVAPFNIAGVPITLVEAERKVGHESRLVTLARDRRGYREDICLELPLLDSSATSLAKRLFSDRARLDVTNRKAKTDTIPKVWQPDNRIEEALIKFRERLWKSKLERFFRDFDFWNFDLYQLDGGLEIFRDGRLVSRLKKLGKKVVCCYTGSDLRTRGVIPVIDARSDLNVTFEFDHLKLHPAITHVFFPFDPAGIPRKQAGKSDRLLIGHAPTNREAKGSAIIIATIDELARRYPVELVLIENLPHQRALALKSTCDVFVDQIGDLGYGINSLESLAMGIPTCSCLADGFEAAYPSHPFIQIDEGNIFSKLQELIEKRESLPDIGSRGLSWLRQYHNAVAVVKQIHRLLTLKTQACPN